GKRHGGIEQMQGPRQRFDMQPVEIGNAREEGHRRYRLVATEGAQQPLISGNLEVLAIDAADRLEGTAQRMARPDALRQAVLQTDEMGESDATCHVGPSRQLTGPHYVRASIYFALKRVATVCVPQRQSSACTRRINRTIKRAARLSF